MKKGRRTKHIRRPVTGPPQARSPLLVSKGETPERAALFDRTAVFLVPARGFGAGGRAQSSGIALGAVRDFAFRFCSISMSTVFPMTDIVMVPVIRIDTPDEARRPARASKCNVPLKSSTFRLALTIRKGAPCG